MYWRPFDCIGGKHFSARRYPSLYPGLYAVRSGTVLNTPGGRGKCRKPILCRVDHSSLRRATAWRSVVRNDWTAPSGEVNAWQKQLAQALKKNDAATAVVPLLQLVEVRPHVELHRAGRLGLGRHGLGNRRDVVLEDGREVRERARVDIQARLHRHGS